MAWRAAGQGEFVLNHHAGDNCTPDSYAPRRLTLEPKSEHRFAPAGGRPTSVGFPYFNLEWPGEGLIVVIGWPGQWAAQFTRDAGDGLRVRGGQELTRFKLHPGEEARSPLIALQFWQGDRVRAQNLWRRWMLAHNLPRTRDGKLPPPILSSCSGGFFPGIRTSEEGERQFITAFAQAGVKLDYWWIDAGWYTCTDWPQTGTWTPDPIRYPRGFRPVSELAHSKGMGLIVWFEPERVTPGTFLYTNNPAWLLGRDGEQKLLNLGNPEARRWLTDHVDAMLTREGIDFYRQDFNIDPLAYWRANDAPDRQGLTEMRHVEGYLAYWDELRRRHPGLLIDSCASGGRRNDLETLRRAVPLLRSDYQAFDGNPAFAPGNQGHTYGLSSWIPYYGQGVYFTDRDFVYSARSYLSPAFAICADVRKPGVDWALIRRLAEQWRQVADCYAGRFLSADLLPIERGAVAGVAIRPARAAGKAWCRSSAAPAATTNPPGSSSATSNPAATYVVTDLDQPAAPQRTQRPRAARTRAPDQRTRAAFRPYHHLPAIHQGQLNENLSIPVDRSLRPGLGNPTGRDGRGRPLRWIPHRDVRGGHYHPDRPRLHGRGRARRPGNCGPAHGQRLRPDGGGQAGRRGGPGLVSVQ